MKRVLVSGNQTFIDAQHNVEADRDVVRQFLDNCCEPCGGDHMPKLGLLYETFKQFCEDFGYSKVLNRRTLLNRIKRRYPTAHSTSFGSWHQLNQEGEPSVVWFPDTSRG